MKERELRIGNIVNFDCWTDHSAIYQGNVEEILRKDNEYTFTLRPNSTGRFVDVKPIQILHIPLTQEWLLKFGFKYNDLNGDSGHWQIKHPNAAGLIQILEGSEKDFVYNYQSEIKYVHQLQNLYFALTGEELCNDDAI